MDRKDNGPTTVVIESSGGGASTRNIDYDEGLRLIIERLGNVDALPVSALSFGTQAVASNNSGNRFKVACRM